MHGRASGNNRPLLQLTRSIEQVQELLQDQIKIGLGIRVSLSLRGTSIDDAERRFAGWDTVNIDTLSHLFTTQEPVYDYMNAGLGRRVHIGGDDAKTRDLQDQIDIKVKALQSAMNRAVALARLVAPAATVREPASRANTNRVFVVHGRDETLKHEVARFVSQLGLKPVVLSEQPSASRTVIEKFEQESAVAFAIVLFTPDDLGALASDIDATPERRARQNVLFELGYFVGKLGRDRVAIVTKGKMEIPSDLAGVIYTDAALEWRLILAKEMKAAGLSVDGNSLLE